MSDFTTWVCSIRGITLRTAGNQTSGQDARGCARHTATATATRRTEFHRCSPGAWRAQARSGWRPRVGGPRGFPYAEHTRDSVSNAHAKPCESAAWARHTRRPHLCLRGFAQHVTRVRDQQRQVGRLRTAGVGPHRHTHSVRCPGSRSHHPIHACGRTCSASACIHAFFSNSPMPFSNFTNTSSSPDFSVRVPAATSRWAVR